jgi:phosphomannomutase
MLLLFDVDGTLTPSRGQIDPGFKSWLQHDCKHQFRLITGSDPEKTQEQVGLDFWSESYVYNCAGNHVFDHGQEVYKSSWRMPTDLEWVLQAKTISTLWPIRTGRHMEHRVGLCNFSTLGRNATQEQRKLYHEWDRTWQERTILATLINSVWHTVEATVAGETGIDIYARGTGKDQILDSIANLAPIHFFGDRQDPAGNDYGLAQSILTRSLGKCYHVRDWQHTWTILKDLNVTSY